MLELIRKLVSLHGVAGYEEEVRNFIIGQLPKGIPFETDNLGNLIVSLGSGPEAIILAAHMDELGMVISDIREDGFLTIHSLGGLDPRILPSRVVRIKTNNGEIRGIIIINPPHLMNNPQEEMNSVIPFDQMFIDIGAESAEEVAELGIEILCPVTFDKTFEILNNKYISARGLDDRCGCAILLELINDLAHNQWSKTILFAFTVQEERGLRGAQLIGKHYQSPYAFAIDSASSSLVPNGHRAKGPAILGKGPALRAVDTKYIADHRFVKEIKEIADQFKIPSQIIISGGSTDAAAISLSGPKSLPISFPIRYTHSTVETVNISDLQNTKILVKTLINHYVN